MRHAASWLAKLHTPPERVGIQDYPARILYRLARKLLRAVVQCPNLEPTMTRPITELERRAEAFAEVGQQPLVQTHGHFHCGHVFVAGDAVTVIDLDRAGPADPARDVAEFLYRFRIEAQKETVKRQPGEDLGQIGSEIFVEQYAQECDSLVPGLLYYWSATLLGPMLGNTLKLHLSEDLRRVRLEFSETEFATFPELVAGFGHEVSTRG